MTSDPTRARVTIPKRVDAIRAKDPTEDSPDEATSPIPARSRREAMLPSTAPSHAPAAITRARRANRVLTSAKEGSSPNAGFHTTATKTTQPTRSSRETLVVQRTTTVGKLATPAHPWPARTSDTPRMGVTPSTTGCVVEQANEDQRGIDNPWLCTGGVTVRHSDGFSVIRRCA